MDSEMPDSSTSPTVAANPTAASKTEPVVAAKNDEPPVVKEPGPSSRTSSPSNEQPQPEKLGTKEQQPQTAKEEKRPQSQQAGEKRMAEADDDEENRKKKQRREEGSAAPAQAPQTAAKESSSTKVGRNVRGGSSERSLSSKAGGAKSRSIAATDRKSPLSVTNSPRKPSSRDHSDSENDDESSKKSSDSTGLKVPPLKIVLTSQGNGNGNGNSSVPSGSVISGQSPASSSEGEQKRNNSGSNESTATSTPETSSSSSLAQGNLNVSYADYHVKKRKLRSQVEDSSSSQANVNGAGSAVGNSSSNSQNPNDPNKILMSSGMSSVGSSIGGVPRTSSEPLNDIEKFLSIRRQVEQRRKNLFPVQPKPPQGFKDYLMNRKTYLLHENAHERLRSLPMIQPPPSLEGPLRELFKAQEEERYKLKMKHLVEKEKLVLSVEQEILRVHGRAARALANQSLPFSVCTFLRDEEIYTPIDPQQEEKNRDIRSRYNGRLFLSWLQDVDDKWEKIKEQMVLRHHNESESLNAVQKMDWEWKVKELSGVNPSTNDSLPPIDDLHIPMVHVSDDFDLDRS